jgi:hypothetical protein
VFVCTTSLPDINFLPFKTFNPAIYHHSKMAPDKKRGDYWDGQFSAFTKALHATPAELKRSRRHERNKETAAYPPKILPALPARTDEEQLEIEDRYQHEKFLCHEAGLRKWQEALLQTGTLVPNAKQCRTRDFHIRHIKWDLHAKAHLDKFSWDQPVHDYDQSSENIDPLDDRRNGRPEDLSSFAPTYLPPKARHFEGKLGIRKSLNLKTWEDVVSVIDDHEVTKYSGQDFAIAVALNLDVHSRMDMQAALSPREQFLAAENVTWVLKLCDFHLKIQERQNARDQAQQTLKGSDRKFNSVFEHVDPESRQLLEVVMAKHLPTWEHDPDGEFCVHRETTATTGQM